MFALSLSSLCVCTIIKANRHGRLEQSESIFSCRSLESASERERKKRRSVYYNTDTSDFSSFTRRGKSQTGIFQCKGAYVSRNWNENICLIVAWKMAASCIISALMPLLAIRPEGTGAVVPEPVAKFCTEHIYTYTYIYIYISTQGQPLPRVSREEWNNGKRQSHLQKKGKSPQEPQRQKAEKEKGNWRSCCSYLWHLHWHQEQWIQMR